MFVRSVTDEIDPPNRKVFETLAAAKQDLEPVRRLVWQGGTSSACSSTCRAALT